MQTWKILTIAAAATLGLSAQPVNVSKVVTGVETATPNLGFFFPNGTPSANVSYYPAVHAKTGTDANDMYPGGWAANWGNSVTNPTIKRQTDSPAPAPYGNGTLTYAKPYTQLAQAGMTAQNKQITSAALFAKNPGSASASTSYTAKIQHFAGPATHYYMTINVPERSRAYKAAFSLCCSGDYNGGTYIYKTPKSAVTRAAVDVYADGLPVWSSEGAWMFPENAPNSYATAFQVGWGSKAAANSSVLLYLGKFNTGQAVNLTVVVRTDVAGDGNGCGDEVFWGDYTRHCMELSETISMKPVGNANLPAMNIWSYSGPSVIIPRS